MKKGTLKWWYLLSEPHQLRLFLRWGVISTDNKRHWCLNDFRKNDEYIKQMLNELGTNSRNFNDLDFKFPQ